MLALKVEEGAVSPGVWAAPRIWKGQDTLPRAFRRERGPGTPGFQPQKCRLPAHRTVRWCVCVV